jgi:hypothetical protein
MKIDSWTGGLEEAGTVREALALTPARCDHRQGRHLTRLDLPA